MKWHTKNCREIEEILECDLTYGLDSRQAEQRILRYGGNKLAEKNKTSLIKKFFAQFNDFMIVILLSAACVSFVISWINGEKDFIDPIIILIIVVLNALLGLFQENKAEKSLEALKKMSAPMSKVIRDGKAVQINTEYIVPGDILVLETGDFVSADARLIKAYNLKAEESALTGESVPVEKSAEYIAQESSSLGDRQNMVFSGSSISCGRGTAIVTETGMNTEVGKIADMIMSDDSPMTPLQKRLEHTGKILGIGALSICFIIFVIGIFRHIEPFQMFMTSVSLAVAAIPEGLPAIVTIMLAIGVQRMAKQNAIIRKLPAVETLGNATVICSDKTGTLTQNVMTVTESWGVCSKKKNLNNEILKLASLCNDSILENGKNGNEVEISLIGDPTETALVKAAFLDGIDKNKLDKIFPRQAEIPFDSKRKLMTTIHRTESGRYLVITKGAPDVLTERCTHYWNNGEACSITSESRSILAQNASMANKALRVLAVAYKEIGRLPLSLEESNVESGLTFVGLIGMIDPPREEAGYAVATCKSAGIKPVMITGDHVITAKAIASKLGIYEPGDKTMTGDELSQIPQEELNKNIFDYSVFARVSPEHKVRIVKAFQSREAVVAMTGDGVNDAPALKAADIGCAMGINGTDVAKEASDMILTDDNFATIVEAVREGRGIYANIRKSVHFLLSSNIGEILTIFVALMMGWSTPLLAIHLLWVNLVTDSLPAIALGLDPADKDIMNQKPLGSQKGLFSGGLWQRISLEGVMIGLLALIAYGIGCVYFDTAQNSLYGRTMAFATLSISQLVHAFNMRSDKSLFTIDMFDNIYLNGAFVTGTLLQVSVIMFGPLTSIFKVTPLSPVQWLVVATLCLMPLVIIELQKNFVFIIENFSRGRIKMDSIRER